jgi:hypothetical protein
MYDNSRFLLSSSVEANSEKSGLDWTGSRLFVESKACRPTSSFRVFCSHVGRSTSTPSIAYSFWKLPAAFLGTLGAAARSTRRNRRRTRSAHRRRLAPIPRGLVSSFYSTRKESADPPSAGKEEQQGALAGAAGSKPRTKLTLSPSVGDDRVHRSRAQNTAIHPSYHLWPASPRLRSAPRNSPHLTGAASRPLLRDPRLDGRQVLRRSYSRFCCFRKPVGRPE